MLARYWWAKATLPISAIAKLEYARLPRIRMMAALKTQRCKGEGDEAAASPASGGRYPTAQKWRRKSVAFSGDFRVLQSVTIRDRANRMRLMPLLPVKSAMVPGTA
jgi:hypothetical protein